MFYVYATHKKHVVLDEDSEKNQRKDMNIVPDHRIHEITSSIIGPI